MAKVKKSESSSSFLRKAKRKRSGVHAKSKTSKLKSSKNYKKSYAKQGH
jgi:hypothetical protein